jgi:hypothetical protein
LQEHNRKFWTNSVMKVKRAPDHGPTVVCELKKLVAVLLEGIANA